MDVFNADGSWAERSGNGMRAAVAHVSAGKKTRRDWTCECGKEALRGHILSRKGDTVKVRAEVARPVVLLSRAGEPMQRVARIMGESVKFFTVDVGNPHAVILCSVFPKNWEALGEKLGTHRLFPRGTNVEFVVVRTRRAFDVKVWERGVGPTGSSGTGAVACMAVVRALDRVGEGAEARFSTQRLQALWQGSGAMAEVSGEARLMFTGEARV